LKKDERMLNIRLRVNMTGWVLRTLLFWFAGSMFPLDGWSQLPPHPDRGPVVQLEGSELVPDSLCGPLQNIQLAFSWNELEEDEGEYDFQRLDTLLGKIHNKGWKAFIRITTDRYPDYIFEMVPCLKDFSLTGKKARAAESGMPMFWHNAYRDRYARLLYNTGLHLRNSVFGGSVLGIIPDIGALVTDEMASFAAIASDSTRWTLPEGMDPGEVTWWTEDTWSDYMDWIHEMHRRAGSGAMWLYLEHAAPLPDTDKEKKMAGIFRNQCRSGEAFGYTHAVSPAPGSTLNHSEPSGSSVTDPRITYWTILYNLHCGASFLSLPRKVALDPVFREDLAFFRKYAGFISHPDTTPGIWIAFREGEHPEGDFTFLMERNRILESEALTGAGSGKYGLWARKVNAGSTFRLKMDADFLESLHPKIKIAIRVWYLDEDRSVFRIHAFGGIHPIQKTGTGEWKKAEIIRRPLIKNQLLDVVAMDGPLTLHMVEVSRELD
jgi:hypothetical protein